MRACRKLWCAQRDKRKSSARRMIRERVAGFEREVV
jgi:hypothetical protein